MKISNETKVGALTAIAITLLILGFNFLKGRSLFKTGNFIYAKYKDTKGIMISNPVFINGLQVGSVYELEEANKNLDSIIVSIKLSKEINIPNNSVASIVGNPLGSSKIDIVMGNSSRYLQHNDTILTAASAGLLDSLSGSVTPLVDQVKTAVGRLDSVLTSVNSILDPYTRANIQQSIANTSRVMASLATSSAYLQQMLNSQSGALAQSLNNLNSFTGTLASNQGRINQTMTNLETATNNFSKADVEGTVQQLRGTVERLNAAVDKLDSRDGSLGLLLNDNQLYNNLANTARSLNILMDDLRVNPKRYVSISIFGGKSKGQPLSSPLPVDTTGALQ